MVLSSERESLNLISSSGALNAVSLIQQEMGKGEIRNEVSVRYKDKRDVDGV